MYMLCICVYNTSIIIKRQYYHIQIEMQCLKQIQLSSMLSAPIHSKFIPFPQHIHSCSQFPNNCNSIYKNGQSGNMHDGHYRYEYMGVNLDSYGIQYVYGLHDCMIDIVSIYNSRKCQFLLPNIQIITNHIMQMHGQWIYSPYQLCISNKLLIIVYDTHVYVHDLVRHHWLLTLHAINYSSQYYNANNNNESGDKSGGNGNLLHMQVLKYDNASYLQIIQHSNSPYLQLSLYQINMASNLLVVFKYKRIIRISQQPVHLLAVHVSHSTTRSGIIVVAKNLYDGTISTTLIDLRCQSNSGSLQVKANSIQMDELIVSNSSLLHQYIHISHIKSSWIRNSINSNGSNDEQHMQNSHKQQKQINNKNTYNRMHCNYLNNGIIIVYKQNHPQLIVLQPHKNNRSKTSLLSHQNAIISCVNVQDTVYVLDDQYGIWAYDMTTANSITSLHSSHTASYQSMGQSNLGHLFIHGAQFIVSLLTIVNMHTESSVKLFNQRNKVTVLVDGHVHTLQKQFPLPISPQLLNNSKIQASIPAYVSRQNPTFLSIQTRSSQSFHSLVQQMVQPICTQMPVLGMLKTGTQVVDIGQYITHIVEYIDSNQLISAPIYNTTMRYTQVQAIVWKIVWIVGQARPWVIGTKWDCMGNGYYWNMCHIMGHYYFNQANHQGISICNDIHFILRQLSCTPTAVQTIMVQSHLYQWLKNRIHKQKYAVSCTTCYRNCNMHNGCSCVYRRLAALVKAIGVTSCSKKINNMPVCEWMSKIHEIVQQTYNKVKQLLPSIAILPQIWKQQPQQQMNASRGYMDVSMDADKQIIQLYCEYENKINSIDIAWNKQQFQLQILVQMLDMQYVYAQLSTPDNMSNTNRIQQLHLIRQYCLQCNPTRQLNLQRIVFNGQNTNRLQSVRDRLWCQLQQFIISILTIVLTYKMYCKQKINQSTTVCGYNNTNKTRFNNKGVSHPKQANQCNDDSLTQATINDKKQPHIIHLSQWKTILKHLLLCLQRKYPQNKLIVGMVSQLQQYQSNYNNLPALAASITKIFASSIVRTEKGFIPLVASVLLCQLYRHGDVALRGASSWKGIHYDISHIKNMKFRYNLHTWNNGLIPIFNIYSNNKHD